MRRIPEICPCGSGLPAKVFLDGYGIFLFYGCPACKAGKLQRFRPDIMQRYVCDEPIEPEE